VLNVYYIEKKDVEKRHKKDIKKKMAKLSISERRSEP